MQYRSICTYRYVTGHFNQLLQAASAAAAAAQVAKKNKSDDEDVYKG